MKSITILFTLLLLGTSCTKDPEVLLPNPNPITTVTDIPDIVINPYNGSQNYYLDVNVDGIKDFCFTVSNSSGCAGGAFSSSIRVSSLNSNSSLLADSIYTDVAYDGPTHVTTQYTIDSLYPKPLSLNDSITIRSTWRKGNLSILKYGRGNCPPNGSYGQSGYWIDQDQKYIGLRYKNYMGWIKVGIFYNSAIKIYAYALSNTTLIKI